jgi:hypothetical protein
MLQHVSKIRGKATQPRTRHAPGYILVCSLVVRMQLAAIPFPAAAEVQEMPVLACCTALPDTTACTASVLPAAAAPVAAI